MGNLVPQRKRIASRQNFKCMVNDIFSKKMPHGNLPGLTPKLVMASGNFRCMSHAIIFF
jgi:hypothetical protein